MLPPRRVLMQVQQKSTIRRCIGLMRCRVLGATLTAWRQWAATQRSMTVRLQQAEVERHAMLKAAVLRRWAAAAVVEAAQLRKLLLVVGTMRASALARCTADQGHTAFLSKRADNSFVLYCDNELRQTASCLRLVSLSA